MLILAMYAAPALALPEGTQPHQCMRNDRGYVRPSIANVTSIVSKDRPLRVWFDPKHGNSAAIADAVLAAAEDSWRIQVDQIGFLPPTLPDADGGPEFDIYLTEYYQLSAYVAADGNDDPVVGDGYNSQSSYMVMDHRMPLKWVEPFMAHEFNHACQWSYDWTESTWPLWEGTATAAEGWTLPDYAWEAPVSSFQEVPFMPTLVGYSGYIYEDYGLGYYFEYGASMWVVWLDENYGDGMGSGGVDLWEATSNEGKGLEPDVVDAFEVLTGMPVEEALAHFAVARFLTGADWDERGLQDAESWGGRRAVPAIPLLGSDLPLEDYTFEVPPFVTGQVFVDVDLIEAVVADGDVARIQVDSASGLSTGLTALWWRADGTFGDEVAVGPQAVIDIDAADLERLVVAVSNGGEPGWDGDDDPYVTGDQTLSLQFVAADAVIDPPGNMACGCAPAPMGAASAPTTGSKVAWAGGMLLLGATAMRRRYGSESTCAVNSRLKSRTLSVASP